MNLLFWNTYNNKQIDSCLVEIITEKHCDIVVLAEYDNDISELCRELNKKTQEPFTVIPNMGGCDRIKGIIRRKYHASSNIEQPRYQIISISSAAYKMIIGMIHNISKLWTDDRLQEETLRRFHHDIIDVENSLKTKNSIIIGDINANPFEEACISADTLCSVPYKEEVRKPLRVVQGNEYQKFYNPMWKFLGRENAPYATYYYNNSGQLNNYYWNIFDQVIIRPQLIGAFNDSSLEILTGTKTYELLEDGKPNKEKYSDHLPIFCCIMEEKIK